MYDKLSNLFLGHFEPQRASVRAGKLGIPCESSPHASALRLRNCKVSARGAQPEDRLTNVTHKTFRNMEKRRLAHER